jgi:hypothetical protein
MPCRRPACHSWVAPLLRWRVDFYLRLAGMPLIAQLRLARCQSAALRQRPERTKTAELRREPKGVALYYRPAIQRANRSFVLVAGMALPIARRSRSAPVVWNEMPG